MTGASAKIYCTYHYGSTWLASAGLGASFVGMAGKQEFHFVNIFKVSAFLFLTHQVEN